MTEKRIVHYKSPIDPVTYEISETEMFEYRGILLEWGIKSDIVPDIRAVITDTVAIVECIESDAEGNFPILTFLPEELTFE